jgi:HlyD family secretion protein
VARSRRLYQVDNFVQEDAIVVPAGALFRKGGLDGPIVVNGRAQLRSVSLLRRSGRLAAASFGLAVGDRVIICPSDRIVAEASIFARRRI